MADVQFGGVGTPVGSGFGAQSTIVAISGAVGTPNFDGSIGVYNEGPVLTSNADNKGINVFTFPGAVIFP
jgi:hypothetical protein